MTENNLNRDTSQRLVQVVQRLATGFARHWLLVLNLFLVLYLGGAYSAPLLMNAGHPHVANVVYTAYSFTCHQLPQRSYFFGGENGAVFATYSEETVVAHGANPTNDLTLRQFEGDAQLGYKAANAHRLSALYFGALLGGLLFALARRWKPDLEPIPLWLLGVMTIPMAIDGTSHLISEVTRLGFRDTNAWAVALTGGAFSAEFYTGTTIGTLNWLLRTVTGLLFGAGIVWYTYPLIGLGFEDVRQEAERAMARRQQYAGETGAGQYDVVGSDV